VTTIESTNSMTPTLNERTLRRALIIIALMGLAAGLGAAFTGHNGLARWIWAAGTIPVVACLAISIARDVRAGRMGVDAASIDQPVKGRCVRRSHLSKTDARTPQIPIDHNGKTEPLPARDFVPWRFSDACRGSAGMVL